METFLDALGIFAVILLVVVGAASGWLAGQIAGRHRTAYIALGIAGALAAPFLLAALGIGILAAGGLALLAAVALAGAVIVLAIGRAIMR